MDTVERKREWKCEQAEGTGERLVSQDRGRSAGWGIQGVGPSSYPTDPLGNFGQVCPGSGSQFP